MHDDIIHGGTVYEHFEIDLEIVVFEWDEGKDALNFSKHGIHFKTAVKAFLDPRKLIREDKEHGREIRYDVLGKAYKIMFIVCSFHENNVIRLISARIASVPEKERYEHGENEDS